ncbi:hypothetical protein ACHAO7_010340 [Fusarium culmorum]
MLPHGILAVVLTRIVLAHEAPKETPVMTAPPNVHFERDIEALLSSFERLASKASEKASAVSTAMEGKETLISDKLEEINSRVMSAMAEAVTQLNEDDDDRVSDGANLNVHGSVMVASAILSIIVIGFFIA